MLCSLKAIQTRPGRDRQEFAIDAQVGVALVLGPARELGVQALAIDYQRREQADFLATIVAQQAGGDGVLTLRFDRAVAVRAMLGAELHEEQAQEVMYLSERADGALAPAAAGALLDGYRGRNAVNCVHIRLARRLHELARVGVQRFEIAALAFGKQDVKGQCGFARAGHPGDHRELVVLDRSETFLRLCSRACTTSMALCGRAR